MTATNEWREENGILDTFFSHQAVDAGRGKLAIASLDSIYSFDTAGDWDAPPTPTTAQDAAASKKKITEMPEEFKDVYIVAPHIVREKGPKALRKMLYYVFGGFDTTVDAFKAGGPDGVECKRLLLELFDDADPNDTALLAVAYTEAQKWPGGEITDESLSSWLENYADKKRVAPLALSDAEEALMINVVGLTAPEIRDRYETKIEANPPKTRKEAVAIIRKILKSRVRMSQIDQAMHGKTSSGNKEIEALHAATFSCAIWSRSSRSWSRTCLRRTTWPTSSPNLSNRSSSTSCVARS